MCDMFLTLNSVYVTGCLADNALFEVADNIRDVLQSLEEFVKILSFGFLAIKRPDKCLLLNTKEQTTLKI